MEFLKEILGEDLFKQVEEVINSWNGNEANKDKMVKLANLATGEYVSKGKFDGLNEQLTGKQGELEKANGLIAELQKATKADEGLQKKITAYETEKAQLQAELAETKLKSAIKVALLSEKAVDVDYLAYKLNEKLHEKGETLELDENDNIKGWDSHLEGLKTQFPNMFGTGEGKDGYKPYNPEGLPKGTQTEKLTREEILKKPYAERNELFNKDPEAYKAAMNA